MKIPSRRILGLISAVAIVATACGSSVTKVEVVSWWTSGDEATGFNAIVEHFNKDNPSSPVTNSAIADGAGAVAHAALQNRVLNGVPPDTFQTVMGHELLDTYVTPGYMDNLDDLYSANGWTAQFPQGLLEIVSAKDFSGKVHYYSVPVNVHRANILWFNKSVFSANNLTPPSTWDQFVTVADALKAKGFTALAVGDKSIWASGQVLETILIGTLGAARYAGLWTGDTDWAGPEVKAALTTYQKVLTYVNSDHSSLSWDQAVDYLIPVTAGGQPKAAMTIASDSAVGEFDARTFSDYGWAAVPGTDKIYDAYGDSFGLPAKALHKDAARSFLTFLGSATAQDLFNPYEGSIPANTAAGNPADGVRDYTAYQKSAVGEWRTDVIVPSLEHGVAASPSWKEAFETAVAAFVAKPDVGVLQASLAQACKVAAVCG